MHRGPRHRRGPRRHPPRTPGACIDSPYGTFSGPATGELRNAAPGGVPPQIEFDGSPMGNTDATVTAVFDLDPATLSVSG